MFSYKWVRQETDQARSLGAFMTEQLTRAGADAGGIPPRIYPDRHFTDDVSGITVAFVDLETFYRRNKADLVFWVAGSKDMPAGPALIDEDPNDVMARAEEALWTSHAAPVPIGVPRRASLT